jgi:hypothetical protein
MLEAARDPNRNKNYLFGGAGTTEKLFAAMDRAKVTLSSLWIKKLIDFTEHAQLYYAQDPEKRFDFLSLKEGEKITYAFKTFEDTDRFWIHVFDILSDTTRKSIPVMIYNPHEWFLLVRTESELYLFDRLVKKNRTLMSLVSEKDPLDIYIKKYFNNTTLQYYPIGEYVFPSKYNVNVFDDFLIEVYLDQKITDEIDGVYKKHKNWSPDVTKELTEIIRKRGKNKLVVSRSKKKSEKIRNLFRKYFAFPK